MEKPEPESPPVRQRVVVRQQVVIQREGVVVVRPPSGPPVQAPAPTGIDISVIGGGFNQPAEIRSEPGMGNVTVQGGQAED